MRHLFTFFTVLIGIAVSAQDEYRVLSKSISTKEGLQIRWTKSIIEDENNLIWTGTTQGISRWDGYNFVNLDQNSSALRNKAVDILVKDYNGYIWASNRTQDLKFDERQYPKNHVLIQKKIDVINPVTLDIISFDKYINSTIKESNIRLIEQTPHGIWIETYDREFFLYTDKLAEIFPSEPLPDLIHLAPSDVDINKFWAFDNTSIYYLNKAGQIISKIRLDKEERIIKSIPFKNNLVVLLNSKNHINTNKFKIILIDPKGNRTRIDHPDWVNKHSKYAVSSNQVFKINQLNNEILYVRIGNVNALFNHNFSPVHVPEISSRLSTYKINYSTSDSNNNLWLSTSEGLAIVSIQAPIFTKYLKNSNGVSATRSLASVNKDTMLVLTEKGPSLISKSNSSFHKLFDPNSNQIGIDLMQISNTRYLATTYGASILDFDFTKNKVSLIPIPFGSKSLHKDKSGTIWIGTGDGVFIYNPTTKTIHSDLPAETSEKLSIYEINYIYSNDSGTWICTFKGIIHLNHNKEIITHYNSEKGLPNERIYFFYESEGIYWLGTDGGGLIKWNPETNYFKQFTTENGLSNNYVHAVYQDADDYLWLPTDQGLNRFDIQNEQFKIFTTSDGLSNNEFNKHSHFEDSNGDLYFGGINGINRFNPLKLNALDNGNHKIVLTQFNVLSATSDEITSKLKEFQTNGTITLKPSDDFINLEYSKTDFISDKPSSYAYKLEGVTDSWQFTKNRNLLLGRLPYGKHLLKIKSGELNPSSLKQLLEIPIIVLKPFYLQWPFLIGCFLLLSLILYLSLQWRISYLEKANSKLQNEVDLRTIELQEVNKSKNKLFAILAHDLRGPISSFSNLSKKVQYLISKGEWETLDLMSQQIEKRTTRLDQLLSNLLPWILTQSRNPEIQKTEINLYQIAENCINQLTNSIQSKDIKIENHLSSPSIALGDIAAVEIIIRNILSNAIKFSANGQTIRINAIEEALSITLSIEDDGAGMNEQKVEGIFNDYIPSEGTKGEKGLGLGLKLSRDLAVSNGGQLSITSIEGQGTTASLRLLK